MFGLAAIFFARFRSSCPACARWVCVCVCVCGVCACMSVLFVFWQVKSHPSQIIALLGPQWPDHHALVRLQCCYLRRWTAPQTHALQLMHHPSLAAPSPAEATIDMLSACLVTCSGRNATSLKQRFASLCFPKRSLQGPVLKSSLIA